MKYSSPQFWEHIDFDHDLIESSVSNRPGSYQGLKTGALYTSAADFINISSHPLIQGTFVDLGAGIGLGPLIYGALHPDRLSIGVEFEEARISAGKKIQEDLGLQNISLLQLDLLKDPLPPGDTYFLYFPTGMVFDRIIFELYHSKKNFRLVLIESHGDLFPRIEKENWLELLGEIPLVHPRHHPMARVYGPREGSRSLELIPHELSFQEFFLLIEDEVQWIGESLGLEWTNGFRYELKTPPRTIDWGQVKEVLRFDQFSSEIQRAILLRRRGELEIKTTTQTYRGLFRKIIIKPTFQVELSSGEKVEWSKILTIKEGTTLCYVSS